MKQRMLFSVMLIWLCIPIVGCVSGQKPRPISDHFDGRHFHNIAPVPSESFSEDVRVAWEMYRHRAPWPKRVVLPQARIENAIITKGIRTIFIGHATVLIQVDGMNILTDPVFSNYIGPNRLFSQRRTANPGVKIEDLPRIDVILISHNHYDHLDIRSLQRIARQQSEAPRILVGIGNRPLLESYGLKNVTELDWGDVVQISGIKVHFLESVHTSRRGLFDTNKTLWGAFLVETRAGNIYFAGDTAYSAHFRTVYQQYGEISIALLPIGAYEPRWFMYREHMNPDEALKAHLDLHSHRSIAIHFGTFNSAAEGYEQPITDLNEALRKYHVDTSNFLVLRPGQVEEEVPSVEANSPLVKSRQSSAVLHTFLR
jgi:L-ascorbate metabolism protein UlaG (beta-lactamase superfamily)